MPTDVDVDEFVITEETKIEIEEGKVEVKGADPEALWAQIENLSGIAVESGEIVVIEVEGDGEYEYKYEDGRLFNNTAF